MSVRLERQPRDDGDAVIALLPVQRDVLIAEPLETLQRKGVVDAFGFLQAQHIRPRRFDEPGDEVDAQVVGGALIGSGIVMLVLASSMPSRTMPGAMIRAMLEAYRRTLEKTMAQARSMGEVVQTVGDPADREPRRRGRVGRRARPPVGGGGGARADGRRRQVRGRAVRLLPGLVRQQLRWRLGRRVGRLGSGPDELVADPQLRRHDGGAGHHRELARVVGLGRRWGRVRRRRLGWRREAERAAASGIAPRVDTR